MSFLYLSTKNLFSNDIKQEKPPVINQSQIESDIENIGDVQNKDVDKVTQDSDIGNNDVLIPNGFGSYVQVQGQSQNTENTVVSTVLIPVEAKKERTNADILFATGKKCLQGLYSATYDVTKVGFRYGINFLSETVKTYYGEAKDKKGELGKYSSQMDEMKNPSDVRSF